MSQGSLEAHVGPVERAGNAQKTGVVVQRQDQAVQGGLIDDRAADGRDGVFVGVDGLSPEGRIIGTGLTAGVPIYFLLAHPNLAMKDGVAIAAPPIWRTFWALFGASNQLLAALTLLGITVWLWKTRRVWWVWVVTGIPTVWMYVMSNWALIRIVDKRFEKGVTADAVAWIGVVLLVPILIFGAGAVEAVAGTTRDVIEVAIDGNQIFGPRDESLVFSDHIENVPEEYRQVGTSILMENDKGQTRSFIVTWMDDEKLTVDGNNPLCGREVVFTLEILTVRDATDLTAMVAMQNDRHSVAADLVLADDGPVVHQGPAQADGDGARRHGADYLLSADEPVECFLSRSGRICSSLPTSTTFSPARPRSPPIVAVVPHSVATSSMRQRTA